MRASPERPMWMMSFAALAQVPADGPVAVLGEVRFLASTVTDFPVDAEGTTLGQAAWLDQRYRVGLLATPSSQWRLVTSGDLLTGQLAGGTWQIPGDVDARNRQDLTALSAQGFRLRQAAVRYTSGRADVEAGLITSHWGLGMVANNGNTDPAFGRSDFGDRVVRLRATRLPGNPDRGVFLTGAADFVIDDEIASIRDEQRAVQAIASALHRDGDQQLGVYVVLRHQREADPTRSTDAGVLDAFVSRPVSAPGGTLTVAAEGATILGRTDRGTSYEARSVLGVAQAGGVAELDYRPHSLPFSAGLRLAYASGDGDPDDGVTSDFTFDRDYGVGMVLFDEVIGGVEAATYALLQDPIYAGQAPDGADVIVTEGSFRRAAALQPTVNWRPGPLDLRTGVMWAFATAPYAQPFYSVRGGGVPYNQHDLPAEGRLLGTEIDWRVAFDSPDKYALRVQVELEGGHLFLGRALRGAGPDLVHLVTATGRVSW